MSILLSRLVFNEHNIFPGDLNKVYRQYSTSVFIKKAEGTYWKERKIFINHKYLQDNFF